MSLEFIIQVKTGKVMSEETCEYLSMMQGNQALPPISFILNRQGTGHPL